MCWDGDQGVVGLVSEVGVVYVIEVNGVGWG